MPVGIWRALIDWLKWFNLKITDWPGHVCFIHGYRFAYDKHVTSAVDSDHMGKTSSIIFHPDFCLIYCKTLDGRSFSVQVHLEFEHAVHWLDITWLFAFGFLWQVGQQVVIEFIWIVFYMGVQTSKVCS